MEVTGTVEDGTDNVGDPVESVVSSDLKPLVVCSPVVVS